jgi:hypothetical protein
MNTDPTDPAQAFLSGVEKRISDDEEPVLLTYGPEWATQQHGAGAPPETLSDPVWSLQTGWIEGGTSAAIICLQAP